MLARATFKVLVTSLKYDPDLGGAFRCFLVLECGDSGVEGCFWNASSVMQKYIKNAREETEDGNPSWNWADRVVWVVKQGRCSH